MIVGRHRPGPIIKLGVQAAAVLFQLPPDFFVSQLPMVAPLPPSPAEMALRKAVDELMDDEVEPWASKPGYAVFDDESSNVVNDKMKALTMATSAPNDMNHQEEDQVEDRKRTPATYGEITSIGARQLFYHMGIAGKIPITDPTTTTSIDNDDDDIVFMDLGSGRGKMVLQAYMELPRISKAMGVELAPMRHQNAVDAWNEIKSTAQKLRATCRNDADEMVPEAEVEFVLSDMLEADLSQVTHMYISSLCFPDNLMHHVAAKLERDAPNLQVVATLRQFPSEFSKRGILDRTSYQVVRKTFGRMVDRTEHVEMTWTKRRGTGCAVHVYTRVKAFE